MVGGTDPDHTGFAIHKWPHAPEDRLDPSLHDVGGRQRCDGGGSTGPASLWTAEDGQGDSSSHPTETLAEVRELADVAVAGRGVRKAVDQPVQLPVDSRPAGRRDDHLD